ncbi:hypothetical protein ACS0TY_028409 [Phlomoides rotata]
MRWPIMSTTPSSLARHCRALIRSCARHSLLEEGQKLHGAAITTGLLILPQLFVGNVITQMYAACGDVISAHKLFDEIPDSYKDTVDWTSLMECYSRGGSALDAVKLFVVMREQGVLIDDIAMVSLFSTCAKVGNSAFGVQGHGCMIKMGLGFCVKARNAAMDIFGLFLNSTSLRTLLTACTQSGDVVMGQWVHSFSLKANIDASTDVKLGTTLLDMYAKCGRINAALRVFKSMRSRNTITWNAMLGGLAMHGNGSMALDMFSEMLEEVKPDAVTFTALLSACSHSGLVDEGRKLFYSLENTFGTSPSMENYACMVDLLGRSGYLDEAEAVIRSMPMRPNEVILGSLLGACRVYRRPEVGAHLRRDLFQMHPANTDHHVLLSNIYASSGFPDEADSLRKDLKDRGIRKVPGVSTMYINGQIHQLCAGDKSHPQINEIYSMLDEMIRTLKLAGYVPDTASQILSDGRWDDDVNEEEEKERALVCHSEKLAVCFGLISTKAGTPLYIFKNLRICQDCHSAMKIASKVYDREITVRDRNRFHSFKNGLCACGDHW